MGSDKTRIFISGGLAARSLSGSKRAYALFRRKFLQYIRSSDSVQFATAD